MSCEMTPDTANPPTDLSNVHSRVTPIFDVRNLLIRITQDRGRNALTWNVAAV